MPNKTISDQVRDAIVASGESRSGICRAAGLDQGAMSRFVAGRGGLSVASLDRLGVHLGLEVVRRPVAVRPLAGA